MSDVPSTPVRVRFAPSPTGYLHIGGLRTALYCYLFARKEGGRFVLRIEDTDRSRFVADAERDIATCLSWAGLRADEGPHVGGSFAPYRQSERSDRYRRAAENLIQSGRAYYAFDTSEELRAMRERGPYDSAGRANGANACTLSADEVRLRLSRGDAHVVRLRVPKGRTVEFHDLIKGKVAIATSNIDDQVLLKSDGMPTYHLANVVDDHEMQITHVIRGEEWVSSTPKHILLYEALDWAAPQMAHLPLIMGPDGGKLSKRNAEKMGIPVSVRQYREAGYEPEALINFLAFLGWNPGSEEEVFSLGELADIFSIARLGGSPTHFSIKKLRWFNQQHLRRLRREDLLRRVRPFLKKRSLEAPDDYVLRVCDLVGERLVLAEDLSKDYCYLFEDPLTYDPQGVRRRWKADSAQLVAAYADRLVEVDPFGEDAVESALRQLATDEGVGAGRVIHPTRLALSGATAGPSLFGMVALLGKATCVRRLRQAACTLGAQA